MTPFDFFNAVQHFQREFDISRLSLGGINHWMVVRLLMLAQLAARSTRETQAITGMAAHSRMIDNPLAELSRNATKFSRYTPRTLERSALLFEPPGYDTKKGKFVFYELPVDYTQVIDGQAVNRIADGFVEAFGDEVQKVCRFEYGLARSECRFDPVYVMLCQDDLPVPIDERERFLKSVTEFCVYMHKTTPDFAVKPSQILTSVGLILRQAAAHEAWLLALKPRAVAFQCYVSMEKIALMVACKRLGITTVEVQHGYTDAYSIFNDMPASFASGQSIMPDVFWSWGRMTQVALASDTGFSSNQVKVLLGGDVWGALAYQNIDSSVRQYLKRMNASDYSRHILLGYQVEGLVGLDQGGRVIPQLFIDAMMAAPKTWLWMIRVHPRSSHMIKPIIDTLQSIGIKNFEVENTTMERIEVVLKAADCYITGFSVSAFEANSIDKPVIVNDKVGRRLFDPLFEDGVFRFADTVEDMLAHLRNLRPPSRDVGYYLRDLAASRRAFDAIMSETYSQDVLSVPDAVPVFASIADAEGDDTISMVPDPAVVHSAEQALAS